MTQGYHVRTIEPELTKRDLRVGAELRREQRVFERLRLWCAVVCVGRLGLGMGGWVVWFVVRLCVLCGWGCVVGSRVIDALVGVVVVGVVVAGAVVVVGSCWRAQSFDA